MTSDEQYPRGKLCDSDEGASSLAIGIVDKTVVIQFAKPIQWFGMSVDGAKRLVSLLQETIARIEEDR